MDRSEQFVQMCEALNLVNRKWVLPLIRVMREKGHARFGELLHELPDITRKALSDKLKEMEELQLVTRTPFRETPPRVEYSLTEMGRELSDVSQSMWIWAKRWFVSVTHGPEIPPELLRIIARRREERTKRP